MRAMETKASKLRAAMAAGDWKKAISIASKFPRLGKHKRAITLGQDAIHNPRFLRQIGKDPEKVISDAKAALVSGWASPNPHPDRV